MGILLAIIGGLWFNQNRGLKAVATETHGALCAFKLNLSERHRDGVRYLRDHPNGITAHGEVIISAAQVQKSLDGQAATLSSLRELDCT